MKHIFTVGLFVGIAITLTAQSFDKDRMRRDLEVAENALGTILKPESGDFPQLHIGENDIEAEYIKDYGVVFNVKKRGGNRVNFYPKPKDVKSEKVIEMEEASEMENNHFMEGCKLFLADYASIIGQLKDDEKISIRKGGLGALFGEFNFENVYFTKGGSEGMAPVIWSTNDKVSGESELIIEASVSKINALRQGKINRDAFLKSVSIVENEMSEEKDPDLETLSAMFHRLYKKDLSKTYYSERQPWYSKLSNFGVIIRMKFYSSYEENNIYSMPTISKNGLTLKERNNHVMQLLPQFEADFNENLVNYARTLKNLDNDEVVMFEIDMTTCKDCLDFPRIMKFSIKKSVLHKYNLGDLSMKEAVNMVSVERILE
jgi:hypothetical protein